MTSKYVVVSGMLFGALAAAQLVRALLQVPVQAGTFSIPIWASWVAAVVAGSLSFWAFRSKP